MNHYVYILEHQETGEFYIGSRSCKCSVYKDKYLGSMSVWKTNKDLLVKTVLKSDFKTRQDALEYEAKLIEEYIDDDLNRNYHIPSKGFHTVGLITVKDSKGKTFNVTKKDPRYLSGKLKHNCKGQVIVKDKEGNCFRVNKNDPRYLSGQLVHHLKNTILVKDFKGNCLRVSKDDPRYLSGELVGITKGKKHSEETKLKLRKSKNKGSKNSQYGTCWIYNKDLKKNRKIKKQDLELWLSKGWLRGRKIKL